MTTRLSKTALTVIDDYVVHLLHPTHRHDLMGGVLDFAWVYTPEEVRHRYSPTKFHSKWVNTFLDHVYWGERHPIIDVYTNKPVDPIVAQDAAWTESAQVVEGVKPDYRFVIQPDDHWLLMEYATRGTFQDVMKQRFDYLKNLPPDMSGGPRIG